MTQALITLNFSSIVTDALTFDVHQGISNNRKSVSWFSPNSIVQYVSIGMVDSITYIFLHKSAFLLLKVWAGEFLMWASDFSKVIVHIW